MNFEYGCPNCNKRHELIRSVAERDDPVICDCGAPCHKLISQPCGIVTGAHGRIGKYGGMCDSLPGEPVFVKSKAHFRELCKERSTATSQLTPLGLG